MAKNPTTKRIALGADHGGFQLKEAIKSDLEKRGFQIVDCGTNSTDTVDYPKFAHAVASKVSTGEVDLGIMVDRAGIGSAMAANKVPGVRAALCYDISSARNSREHNNANVLTLGSGLIGPDLALQIVDVWLSNECKIQRHLRRAAMIEPSGWVQDRSDIAGRAACACASTVAGNEEQMDSLSEQDIERIVQRIVELSNGSGGECNSILAGMLFQACPDADPECIRRLIQMGADRVGHQPGAGGIPNDLASYIDHTLLRPDATTEDILELCAEAESYGFASVCVNPSYARTAADRLKGTGVLVCTVVGFPMGAHVPEIKALEARRAIRDGAREIDMVINIGALKSGDDELVYRDIRAVTDACMDGRARCKVILETALLSDDEKIRACQSAKRARADFVKTSTGFGGGGATADDVALMAEAVHGAKIEVKASGGIRSYEDAQKMIRAGATRLGVSAGIKIIKESKGLTIGNSE